ncbi:MAG TPA: single-stranded DNA-binding protein [Spirochaetota bacterium]|jgi:single-strand DNA-binding protein|nr:MAG: Single-stranded DNA-binding protein [Spirochaetes bacterium ADurb.Bin133]HNZ25897.1 single-stranded DNA-binding protein [Spirochaetota bacterium]HPY87686.1 single-stranded DNA-binding protein [Spirochaetota bacterium]HQB62190.1 single-stranded DNA-binding protein [Spirochaetota bacterium]
MAGRDLNVLIIIGRLVKDPEIKYTASGTPIAKFAIANNASYIQNGEKKELTNFFDVNVWGNQAVNCEKYLKKGSQVAIEGYIRQNRWTDNATGKTASKVEITANSVQFIGGFQSQSSDDRISNDYRSDYPQTNNFKQDNAKPQNKTMNPNPWNDDVFPGGDEFLDDSFSSDSNFGGTDDDIPF